MKGVGVPDKMHVVNYCMHVDRYTLVNAFLRVTFFKPNWADIYGTDWDMVL